MKIGIIGDIHAGASYALGKTDPITQLNSRLLDYATTFNSIIDNFEKQDVKIVVITGDTFDQRSPSPAQVNIFSKSAKRAVEKGMKILMVVGNHDQQRTISTTTTDIYNILGGNDIVSYPNFDKYTIDENDQQTHLIFMPYRDRKMMFGSQTNNDAIDKIKAELRKITTGLSGQKIAIGHFMVDKAVSGESSEVFSMSELILPMDVFAEFDAVFMGHVHKHEIISKTPITMYVGSMERNTMGDKDQKKVTAILDTKNIKNIELIETKTRNLYELEFDYSSNESNYKTLITDQVISDIDAFDQKNKLEDSVVKMSVKVKEADMYYVNKDRIKEYLLNKKINFLSSMQTTTVTTKQLRNKDITESVDSKTAMASFIKTLSDTDNYKKKLQKFANSIIEEVEGK